MQEEKERFKDRKTAPTRKGDKTCVRNTYYMTGISPYGSKYLGEYRRQGESALPRRWGGKAKTKNENILRGNNLRKKHSPSILTGEKENTLILPRGR